MAGARSRGRVPSSCNLATAPARICAMCSFTGGALPWGSTGSLSSPAAAILQVQNMSAGSTSTDQRTLRAALACSSCRTRVPSTRCRRRVVPTAAGAGRENGRRAVPCGRHRAPHFDIGRAEFLNRGLALLEKPAGRYASEASARTRAMRRPAAAGPPPARSARPGEGSIALPHQRVQQRDARDIRSGSALRRAVPRDRRVRPPARWSAPGVRSRGSPCRRAPGRHSALPTRLTSGK